MTTCSPRVTSLFFRSHCSRGRCIQLHATETALSVRLMTSSEPDDWEDLVTRVEPTNLLALFEALAPQHIAGTEQFSLYAENSCELLLRYKRSMLYLTCSAADGVESLEVTLSPTEVAAMADFIKDNFFPEQAPPSFGL